MCVNDEFRAELIKIGFNKYKETYTLFITDYVYLTLDYLDTHKVFAVYVAYKGDPICSLRDIIPVTASFNIVCYVTNILQQIRERYTISGNIVYVINSINSWLFIYSKGYDFLNFKKACYQGVDISYQFNLDGIKPTLIHNYSHNDIFEVHFGGELVGRFLHYKIQGFQHDYEILHTHAYGFAEVKSHIRKTIIDNLLENL